MIYTNAKTDKKYQENISKTTNSFSFLTSLASDCRSLSGSLLGTVKKESTILYYIALAMFTLGLGCLLGLFIDDRTLMGVNVWLKPLKFSISIGIFLLTTGYLITKYPYTKSKKRIINHVTGWTLLLEMAVIALQAARGVKSHYNTETLLDGIFFMSMGIFVGINVVIMAVFMFDTVRLKLRTTKPMQWAILLGWSIVLFGSWVGGQMIGQMSHNIGVADGGPGLPLVNWSTVGGDLRIAHFFALHGIQIIPLFALGVSKKLNISIRNQVAAVSLFALVYAAYLAFVFYQAKQGLPFIQ